MSSRRFPQIVTLLVCVLVIDLVFFRTLGNAGLYRSNSSLSIFLLPLVILSLPIQYFLLRYTTKLHNFQEQRVFVNSVNIAQIIIMILLVIETLRTLLSFDLYFFNSLNLVFVHSSIVSISYALATIFLGMISYRFYRYYKNKKKIVSMIYGLSFSVLTLNAILNLARIDVQLGYFVFLPVSVCGQFEASQSCPQLNILLLLTLIVSYLLLWTATIFRMYTYKAQLGKKIWTIVLLPITLILSPLLTFNHSIFEVLLEVGGGFFVLTVIFPIISYFSLRFIPSYAFGAGIWTPRKFVTDIKKQNAIMVAGAGLFLYLITMNQTVTTSIHFVQSYVPFGIVGISMIGLFAYMISAIVLRNDEN
jgi:hypothetical protein